jgi:hypothetical protein
VNVGNVVDISKVRAASIFRVEVCRAGELMCIYRLIFLNTDGRMVRTGNPSGPVNRDSATGYVANN